MIDVVSAWEEKTSIDPSNAGVQGYIAAADGQVLFSYNDPTCRIDQQLATCIPNLASLTERGRMVQRDGDREWFEFIYRLPNRDMLAIRSRANLVTDDLAEIVGVSSGIGLLVALGAVPIAALLALVTVRPLMRRIDRIARASADFGDGNVQVRSHVDGRDEIGLLGQQFDRMAETISTQLGELRQLAAENNTLALATEQHARSAERATISRDLHDSVAQHLFSLAMGTASLAALIQRDPEQAAQQAEQLASIAAQAQDELRGVLTMLRPGMLDGQTLAVSLRELAHDWQDQTGIALTIRFQLEAPIPLLIEDVLYRVCQESLNNIARHANAQQASITITRERELVRLIVHDDGRGFDPATSTTGVGLLGMRERVRALGGELLLASTPAHGTQLEARIPIADAHEVQRGNHTRIN
jgi:signal transduction histidine kinase